VDTWGEGAGGTTVLVRGGGSCGGCRRLVLFVHLGERGRMGEARFNRTEMVRDLVTVENGDGGSVAKFGSSNGALAVR
jgi:hypothetical protein